MFSLLISLYRPNRVFEPAVLRGVTKRFDMISFFVLPGGMHGRYEKCLGFARCGRNIGLCRRLSSLPKNRLDKQYPEGKALFRRKSSQYVQTGFAGYFVHPRLCMSDPYANSVSDLSIMRPYGIGSCRRKRLVSDRRNIQSLSAVVTQEAGRMAFCIFANHFLWTVTD